MSVSAITFEELLVDSDAAAAKWLAWFEAYPEALELPCDVSGSQTVGEFVHHIFAVQLRHSQRLLAEPVEARGHGTTITTPMLADLAAHGSANLQRFVKQTSEQHAAEIIHFAMRDGTAISASRRKLFLHLVIHSIRHWAQLSSLLRQRGFALPWGSDFLESPAMT